MRQLVCPIFERRGTIYNPPMTLEGDRFVVLFKTPKDALMAAIEIKECLNEYNTKHLGRASTNKDNFKIHLSGIGIHCGRGLIIDKSKRFHGDVYNIAERISEDCANGGSLRQSSGSIKIG
jgi:hypothetical protein